MSNDLLLGDFIRQFPSLRELANELGLPVPTVTRWRDRNSIPGKYWLRIEHAARARGLDWITVENMAAVADEQARPAARKRKKAA